MKHTVGIIQKILKSPTTAGERTKPTFWHNKSTRDRPKNLKMNERYTLDGVMSIRCPARDFNNHAAACSSFRAAFQDCSSDSVSPSDSPRKILLASKRLGCFVGSFVSCTYGTLWLLWLLQSSSLLLIHPELFSFAPPPTYRKLSNLSQKK